MPLKNTIQYIEEFCPSLEIKARTVFIEFFVVQELLEYFGEIEWDKVVPTVILQTFCAYGLAVFSANVN